MRMHFVVLTKGKHNFEERVSNFYKFTMTTTSGRRNFGSFQIDWTSWMINGLILKKALSSIFRSPYPPTFTSLFSFFPSALFFSLVSLLASYIALCLSKDAHGHRRTAKNKNAEGRIDEFIVKYHLQGVPQILDSLNCSREFIPSFFSFLLPAAVLHRHSHPSVMDSHEKMKSRLWFIAKRSSLPALSAEETYIANTRRK